MAVKQCPNGHIYDQTRSVGCPYCIVHLGENDAVVGWLVCVEGPEKGQEYRIRVNRNSIGRSMDMDICIEGDTDISKSDRAVIFYDKIKHAFSFSLQSWFGNTYVNDIRVSKPVMLKPLDKIKIGKSLLVLIPLIGEEFNWL